MLMRLLRFDCLYQADTANDSPWSAYFTLILPFWQQRKCALIMALWLLTTGTPANAVESAPTEPTTVSVAANQAEPPKMTLTGYIKKYFALFDWNTTNDSASTTQSPKTPLDNISTPKPPAPEPSLYALLDAEFAIDRGEVERGLAIYKQQAFKEDATAVFERALGLSLSFEDTQSSLAFAAAWQQQHPDHVPAWFYVAHLALKAHDYDLAGETLSRILAYDPRADLSEILIGIYPNREEDQRELLTTLQPLDSKHNASLSVLKAGLLLKFNEPKAALLHVDQALGLQPNNVPVITLKADILRKLASTDEVLSYIEQAKLRLPANKSLYLYEIRYLLQQQRSQQAWLRLIEAHKRFENDAEITLLAALVSLDIEAYSDADRLLNQLVKDPQYLDQAYYYLGVSAERQHEINKAKGYFKAVMQEDLVLAARKKVVLFELMDNQPDAAIATLKQLREQFDIFAPDSYIMQADILRQQNALDKAQALLATANQKYPNNEALLFARAQLLDNRDDFIIKRTLLNHLLTIKPNDFDYQLAYSGLLLANDPNSQKGLEIATSVSQLAYDDPNYESDRYLEALNLLASSALAKGDYQQVIRYLQTPYDVMPTLDSGVLLLRAYQALDDQAAVTALLAELQRRFAAGQQNINDIIQQY
ncbi:MAG: hypothetical protein Q4P13_12540 [Psychrobacter sp.]|nr:hypothetical protein [Psychrobacter sp.]